MSDFRSRSKPLRAGASRLGTPTAALDAALEGASADPIRRAIWLDALDRRLVPLLPPALAPHARLANVDRNRLVFLVDSPIWHARLRLAADGLIDAARSIGLEVDKVAIRTSSLPRPRSTTATSSVAPKKGPAIPAALKAALASLGTPSPEHAENDSRQDGS